MLILNTVFISGITVEKTSMKFHRLHRFFSLTAAGDLIAREAGAYTCDPSGVPLNLVHRRILCAATKELAEQISPLLTHLDFPHD